MNNELFQQFQTARLDPYLVVLEGFHAVKHALRFGGDVLVLATIDPDVAMGMAADLAPDVAKKMKAMMQKVSADVFDLLSTSPHPTGLIAIARRPEYCLETILSDHRSKPVVLLENPRNLGNLGAAMRVSAAAGAAGVITIGSSDPWSAQAVRGAAGLQFALPVVRATDMPDSDRPIVAIHPEDSNIDWQKVPARAVMCFGTERSGLSKDVLGKADFRVKIPMEPGVSSLNLVSAVAVMLYAQRLKELE